jgi:hypothetical protein
MSLSLWAEEEESQAIEKIEAPDAVTKAFEKDYPEMVMTGIETEEIEGVTYYEIECGEGETDIIYLADGTLHATEQEIAVDDLPQEVTDALNTAYPGAEIEEAEMITRGSRTEFEVEFAVEEEEEIITYEIAIASDGEITSEERTVEVDEDEEPDDINVDDEGDED